MRLFILALVACGACSFPREHFFDDDADVSSRVTIGFASATSIQDESSGDITVAVRLEAPAAEDVVIDFTLQNGTADSADYMPTTGAFGTLTFRPGEIEKTIGLRILPDGVEEQDETIEISLSRPSDNAMLGIGMHTVTISSAVLPRATVMTLTGSAMESAPARVVIALDIAPVVESTVTIAMKTTGSASTFDYTAPTILTATFPIGSMMQMIDIPIVNDTTDEEDETVVVELASSTSVVIGVDREYTHTILDNDVAPTVAISAATSINEGSSGATNVNITVLLSAGSGRVVSIPFTHGGTATKPADYSYTSEAALVFQPNQNASMSETQKTITITVVADAIDEDNQTVITMLGTPTNATLGSTSTQTHTIVDDDNEPTIQFMSSSQMTAEGNAGTSSSSYFLILSSPSEKTISLNVGVTGSAAPMTDYTTTPALSGLSIPLVVTPGQMSVGLGVNVVGDTLDEGDEVVTMTIPTTGMVNVVAAGANLVRTHTIFDDD